jgi:hypothetical protein
MSQGRMHRWEEQKERKNLLGQGNSEQVQKKELAGAEVDKEVPGDA